MLARSSRGMEKTNLHLQFTANNKALVVSDGAAAHSTRSVTCSLLRKSSYLANSTEQRTHKHWTTASRVLDTSFQFCIRVFLHFRFVLCFCGQASNLQTKLNDRIFSLQQNTHWMFLCCLNIIRQTKMKTWDVLHSNNNESIMETQSRQTDILVCMLGSC